MCSYRPMLAGQNEAFSRILIDKALEFSGWNLLDPKQVGCELSSSSGRADYFLKDKLGRVLCVLEAMDLVFNERLKHTAAWLNALATAVVAAGTFAPAAALIYGLSSSLIGGGVMFGVGLACFAFGICLHFGRRVLLGRLRQ